MAGAEMLRRAWCIGGTGISPTGVGTIPAVAPGPLTPTEFSSAVTAITSAFGDPTRREIYLFARERPDGVTAAEVAERFDLHPNVARHHLDKLAGGGYLEVARRRDRRRRRSAVQALPGHRAARRRSSSRSATTTCSSRCSAGRSPCCPARRPRRWPRRSASSTAGSWPGRSGGTARPASARSAPPCTRWPTRSPPTASPPTPRSDGNELRIVSEHCPFGDAAIEHPVICAVDRGMVKGMLGALYGDNVARHSSRRSPWATTSASPPSKPDVQPVARHYLDHASTSPLRPEARRRDGRPGCERPATGDPGRIHAEGMTRPRRARAGPRAGRRPARRPLSARSCSPAARPSRSPRPPWGAAERGGHQVVLPPSSTRRCASERGRRGAGDGRPSSASTGSAGSTPTTLLAAIRPDTALVHVQWGNHEVGTVQPVAEVVARLPRPGRARPRRRRAGRRPRADRLRRARRRPAVGQRPQVRRPAGHRRAARAPRPAAAAAAASAATRSGPGGPASRTCRRSSGSARACEALRPATAGRRGDDAARGSPTASLARRRELDGVRRLRRPRRPAAAPRVPRRRRHRAAGGAARPRPGRHRRPLRQRVLVRGARAVAGARGHGRRRAPLAAPLGRLVDAPTPTSTRCSTRSPPCSPTSPARIEALTPVL